MYYKITAELKDKVRGYKKTTVDIKPFDSVYVKKEIRSLRERDYFKIEKGVMKLISGSRNTEEFENAEILYPQGSKEISLFLEKNANSIIPIPEILFAQDYKMNQQRNNLFCSLIGIDMSIEDLRRRSDNPPTAEQKKGMKRLWSERTKILKDIAKIEKNENLLLEGKKSKDEKER